MAEMTPDEVWCAFVGERGIFLRQALTMLLMVPEEKIRQGIEQIERETALGPLLNPSAYVDGTRFDNARDYLEVLEAACKLRGVLARVMERGCTAIGGAAHE